MNTATKIDLADLQSVMEALQKRLVNMDLKTKVDVAARLRAASKTIEVIDAFVKEDIKKQLKNKAGVVNGEVFKAWLQLIQCTRLNQERLKVEYPGAYEKCLETKSQGRITFEAR